MPSPRTKVTWKTTKVKHGTTGGYRFHQKLGEVPCKKCHTAKKKYDTKRRNTPERKRINRLTMQARDRAEKELRHLHPEEWTELYQKHLKKVFVEARGKK